LTLTRQNPGFTEGVYMDLNEQLLRRIELDRRNAAELAVMDALKLKGFGPTVNFSATTPEKIEETGLIKALSISEESWERNKMVLEPKEGKTFDTSPIKTFVVDYGEAGNRIDRALTQLNEGLPNGQKRRVEAAFKELQRGVSQLHSWLLAKGLDV
jgi:hypothetical protein